MLLRTRSFGEKGYQTFDMSALKLHCTQIKSTLIGMTQNKIHPLCRLLVGKHLIYNPVFLSLGEIETLNCAFEEIRIKYCSRDQYLRHIRGAKQALE